MMSNLWARISLILGLGTIVLTGCQKPEVTPVATTPPPTAQVEEITAIPIAPISPTATSAPDLPAVAEGLEGLDIDTFFETSYLRLGKRCPECLSALGLSAALGMRDDQLNNMSDAFIRETQDLEKTTLMLLRTYDRSVLTPEQRLSYDVYAWYLEDQIRGHEFMYYDYIIRPGAIGYQDNLVQMFTDLHPLMNKQNAEDYVVRLWQVETQMQQVVEGLTRRDEIGVRLPRGVLQWIGQNLRDMADSTAKETPFYTAFEERLGALDNVSAADKTALLKTALDAIEGSVLPGFGALADFVEQQQQRATDTLGVSRFPNGEAYYAYLLHHYTTSDLTADEVHNLGQQDLTRIHAEMRAAFEGLGYPSDGNIPDLYSNTFAKMRLL